MSEDRPQESAAVAVVGLAGRFPGAKGSAELWANLCAGRESITRFRPDELEDDFDTATRNRPDFVAARSILPDIDMFDAGFFGMMPREAAFTDPQQRVFLECCWEALEAAGYNPSGCAQTVGIYAGSSFNTYLLRHVAGDRERIGRFTSDFQVGSYAELVGALPEFLTTRVAYKLDLKGPAVNVASACSTSLLAVAQACQALLNYQCDMALAGGVSITLPQRRGFLATEGGMVSPTGRCRPFDAAADGTIFGSGAGVVVMKRLDDAIADGDFIWGVIRGFGVNNDGAGKVGFAAPSVHGQATAIQSAHAMAGVTADAIGYVETHGTGTPLGDPIEFAALTEAFRATSSRSAHCMIGSAKANLGHLDAAAGVVGLIKTLLVLDRETVPGLLHFQQPNPNLPLTGSPFTLTSELRPWPRSTQPRLAGVSSFGVGGTNVHLVVGEAPLRDRPVRKRGPVILPLAARSASALATLKHELIAALGDNPAPEIADVAWTLQTGRREFPYRFTCVAETVAEARTKLAVTTLASPAHKALEFAFLFPGQGAQHAGMARDLYTAEPAFRQAFDRCDEILKPVLGARLSSLFDANCAHINETWFAQPAIFAVSYALADLWETWGVRPHVMVGHSVGEMVAACRAGIFELEDALRLVVARGRLMQGVARGSMLSVRLSAAALAPRLTSELSIAAVNAPELVVVAGPSRSIEALAHTLEADSIQCRTLATSHAFHSAMMEPAVIPFRDLVRTVRLSPPRLPIISTLTGARLTDEQATDPDYWARHMRETVAFSAAIGPLRSRETLALVEVGPGIALATLARQHVGASKQPIVSSLPPSGSGAPEHASVLKAAGQLWEQGGKLDWEAISASHGSNPLRVPLPTYPFERQRHWIDRPGISPVSHAPSALDTSPAPVHTDSVGNHTMSSSPSSPSEPSKTPVRQIIETRLLDIFQRVSGLDLAETDPNRSFLDLGFDSLLLTQAARAVQNAFGIKVAFRQLMGDEGCLAALATWIEARDPKIEVPPTATPVAQTPTAVEPLATSALSTAPTMATSIAPAMPASIASVGGTGVEQLMREQLQLVGQLFAGQMETLKLLGRGGDQTAPMPAPAANIKPMPIAASSAPVPPAAASTATASFGPFKALQASGNGELTAHQKKHLDALIARVLARTPKSKAQTERHRQRLADPRVVAGFRDLWKEMIVPVVVDRSKGSRLWDIDGNEYIDLLNGFGPIMFGHRPEFIEQALVRQLADGLEIGPQTPLAGEIAEMFCALTGNERMTYCNTGSEAVMAAFRIARTVTGRDKIVMFSGDYHGMFDEVLVTSKGGQVNALPIAPGIPRESVANMHVLEYGTAQSMAWIRANASNIAAVIVEPVQSRRPDFQPVAFLKELREVTAAAGTALVFDEIVTGFRVHPGGCQALFGIRADMATYGKVLGGGMPIGVLAGKAEFMDALDGGAWSYGDASVPEAGVTFFAGTFVRHPLTLAAVKAVLAELIARGPALQERLTERTASLVNRINMVFEQYAVPTRVHHFGSIMFFKLPTEERLAGLMHFMLREQGLHVLEGFPFFLTTEHSDADIDTIVAAFGKAAHRMREGQFLSSPGPATLPVLDRAPARCRLTEAQREVFLAAMLDREVSTAFNESLVLTLRGPLDAAVLRRAMAQVIDRHEALRAYVDADGEHLVVERSLEFLLRDQDLSALPQALRDAAFRKLLDDEARTAFNLHTPPLIRGRLVKVADDHHALVITAHHIVCDGWSTNVIIAELSELYSAGVGGSTPSLPAALSFTEYAETRSQEASAGAGRQIERYWLDLYKDKPLPLDLPTDRVRGSMRTYAGATARHPFSAEFATLCRQFAATEKSSLFMVLFAGFNGLLARLSGSTDIVVGVPMAAQAHLDGGNLVGHCVDFLPLRSRVDAADTFRTLLKKVRDSVLDGADNQSYTYGTLVARLAIPRDPARLPLTEVHFNLEQIGGNVGFIGLRVDVEPNSKTAVNPDLFLNLVDSDQGLTAYCDYNTDLYSPETIDRWMHQFEVMLKTAIANPEARLAGQSGIATDLSPSSDRAQIANWNATKFSYPKTSVSALVAQQAAKTPARIAVSQGTNRLSYAELNARANWYAVKLIDIGITRGALVGICVSRTPEMLAVLLGIMKTGAAYVPLDPTHPKDRLKFILDDAKVAVIVSEDEFAGLFDGLPTLRLTVDAQASGRSRHPDPSMVVTASDPAYVMFTSGSTGRPKGVAIHHGALVNLLTYCIGELECRTDDIVAAIATIGFDISCIELYLPLITGACVEVVDQASTMDGFKLANLIAERGVTLFQATPATWRLLLNAGWQGAPLMRAISTGEPLPRDVAEAVLPRVAKLWNGYGPTETTIWSTLEQVRTVSEPITIGRPVANTQIHIVGETGDEVAAGEVGEIWIGGDGVAVGYLDRPELTAERFVQQSDGRRYRTGDLGRWLPDGRLMHLGRIDHQVKIRGFRIELGEIEAVLQEVAGISQAVVVADKREGSGRLVAFCVSQPNVVVTKAAIDQYVSSKLPDYMVPVSTIILDQLPVSPNGKIDRIRLLEIERERQSVRTIVEPATADEKKLVDIIKHALQVESVGVTDNLFELGIDSLKFFQISSRANKENINITPRILMLTRSIRAALAEAEKAPLISSVARFEIKPIPRDRMRRPPG